MEACRCESFQQGLRKILGVRGYAFLWLCALTDALKHHSLNMAIRFDTACFDGSPSFCMFLTLTLICILPNLPSPEAGNGGIGSLQQSRYSTPTIRIFHAYIPC